MTNIYRDVPSHKRRGSSLSSFSRSFQVLQTKRFPLIFLVMLFANFWIISTYFPSTITTSPSSIIHQSPFVTNDHYYHLYDPYGRAISEPCPDYGCPIYPAELTPYLHQVLHAMFDNNNNSNNNNVTYQKEDFDFGTDTMALLTQTGKSHFYNQDRSFVISPFRTAVTKNGDGNDDNDDDTTNNNNNSFLIGILDGHGVQGHIVANHVARELPDRLAEKLNEIPKEVLRIIDKKKKKEEDNHAATDRLDQAIVQALKETFVEVDIEGTPNFLLGGCTASVTLRRGSKLYVANAGDSQTIVVAVKDDDDNIQKEPEIPYMTRKDKASLPDEYKRIVGLGGTVRINNQTGDSRVNVYSRTARESIGLAMSRSIGDWEWKPVGVTAEPLVDIVNLDELRANKKKQLFLIAASDGIWDMRRREFYAKQFTESLYNNNDRGKTMSPLQKVWDVIQKVTPKRTTGYRDDMSLIVTKL